MTHYPETRESSGELLRMILPLLSKQDAGFHPKSYTLWYEYASGVNPDLKREVNKIMASGKRLDEPTVAHLYEKYITQRDDAVLSHLRSELERMLQDLSRRADLAGEQANDYGKSLDGFGAQLKLGIDPEQLKAAVHGMLAKTEQMCARTSELKLQLQKSNREVQELRAELHRAKGEAVTDPLTGVANRRGFLKAVERYQACDSGALDHSCLIVADIDHFKQCNDSYGHLFGDKVLRNVGQVLQKMVKGQDIAARIGGEEFVVFLPDTPIDGAAKLAEHIRATIAAGRIGAANQFEAGRITLSLGVTDFRAGDNMESLLARADKAMYAAKAAGRNRVTVDAGLSASAEAVCMTPDPAANTSTFIAQHAAAT